MTLVLSPQEIVEKLEAQGQLGLLDIAPNWHRRTLKEFTEIQNGAALASSKFNNEKRGMPIVRIRDVQHGQPSTWYDGPYEEKYIVDTGDILVGMDGDFHCSRWHGGPALLNQRVCKITTTSNLLDDQFLFLILPGYLKAIWDETSATTVKHLSSKSISEIPIPVPPIEEQIRIVEVIEEHLSRIDSALEDVKQAREKADQFRRSLLHAAFTGQLTNHDKSLAGVTKGWNFENLSNLLETTIGGIWGGEPGSSEVDVRVVRVTELKEHGRLDLSSAVTRSITAKQLISRELKTGDLILEKSGGGPNSPVGRVGYISIEENRNVCSNFMQLMRPNINKVVPMYLFQFLNAFHANGGTIPLQTATTNIRNIKTQEYMGIKVPIPSIKEQIRIVEILEEHLSRIDTTLETIDNSERTAAQLRRSLLHAAFTGQLTKEDANV